MSENNLCIFTASKKNLDTVLRKASDKAIMTRIYSFKGRKGADELCSKLFVEEAV
jgi:hypothetical protein